MDGDANVATVGLGYHGGHLVLRDTLGVARPAVRHFDEIYPVLSLAAHLLQTRRGL